jgi:hypothetical protein
MGGIDPVEEPLVRTGDLESLMAGRVPLPEKVVLVLGEKALSVVLLRGLCRE